MVALSVPANGWVSSPWQRGEATEQDWLDKVQQIRERYPHPEKGEK